jgi:hypothetical protein
MRFHRSRFHHGDTEREYARDNGLGVRRASVVRVEPVGEEEKPVKEFRLRSAKES